MCCIAGYKPKTWFQYLAWAEFSFNSSFHSAIQMTSFRALYGRDLPAWVKFENGSTTNAELEGQLKEHDAALQLLKEHLHRAQQIMKERADKHRREIELAVGHWVYVKLRPYRQRSLARRLNEKLSARFYGPFEVKARVCKVAYKLKFPAYAKIHPTFYISQLKIAVGEVTDSSPLPPQLSSEGELVVQPEKVVGTRLNGSTGQIEVLIKLRGLPSHECTWEWASAITKRFPTFDLEDKVNFDGGGNDMSESNHHPILC